MYRVRWRSAAGLACFVGIAVLLMRGCYYASVSSTASESEDAAEPAMQDDLLIRVSDARTGIVSEVPLEEYLIGVVAAEMPASFEPEALAAQAVAARTYTVRKLLRGGCRSSEADICTESGCCQAFASEERQKSRWTNTYAQNRARVASAVQQTAGEILLYGGEPIEALYHSASGGSTEDSEHVFAVARPYLRAVESTYETGTSRLSDTVVLSYADFCKRINDAYPAAGISEQRLGSAISIESRTASGRVQLIRLGGVVLTGKRFRYLMDLDSTLFTVTLTGGTVRMDSKGFGHGVGLSQTGANGMAEQGADYVEILQHYYTDVMLASWRTLSALQDGE